jgi:hypothetical protein
VAFERIFSQMEDMIAPIFRRLYDERREPSVEELGRLLSFAALQYIRVPAFRPVLLKIADSIHRGNFRGAEKSVRLGSGAEEGRYSCGQPRRLNRRIRRAKHSTSAGLITRILYSIGLKKASRQKARLWTVALYR